MKRKIQLPQNEDGISSDDPNFGKVVDQVIREIEEEQEKRKAALKAPFH